MAALALFVNRAQAADGTWIFNNSGAWSTATNWSGSNIADGADSTADFSTINITSGRTVTLDSSRTIGHLRFGDTTPTHDWSLAASGGSVLTLQVGAAAPSVEIVNQSASISAVLAGAQGFTKTGVGTLSVSGNNSSLSGDISVRQGALFWNVNNNALGSGTITLNDVGTGGNNTGLFRNAAGTLANNIIVANQGSGTATIGSDVSQVSITYSGTVTLNRAAILKAGVNPNPSTVTFTGDITGGGGVTISGGGIVAFNTTAKTYTGGTTLSEGTLRLGADNVVPDTGTFTFAGGILAANNRTDSIGQLSLTADSSLNLTPDGTAGQLTFASASYSSGTLLITGWTGTSGGVGTDDRIFITDDPTLSGILGNIQFDGYAPGATWLSGSGELVPVPEPVNVALGIFGVMFAAIGLWRRHRASRST
ncbi:MAG: hypothetical protein IH623_07045 [Verrucomicrobia bacterium]|nr:hypothetical protein [Verrucomicrobiota bacterium]